mgnify:CR=1 FL=1
MVQRKQKVETNANHDTNINTEELDACDYHAMASVAELLVTLRDENKKNKHKSDGQQYTNMEFVDKKTGEVTTQRVLF